ncbi:MAG TPA: ribosome-associated translation inhibitor RaiA [Anaerolineae bacterium]|nr:ribosome-associated translation inhibitor RaiA [Anaerolineae bacterium]
MNVQIYNRNLELTERLSEYVESKVERLSRYLADIEDVRVDLSATNARDASRRMVAQITIRVPRSVLRAEERAGDVFSAFDAVMDKMERQIRRYKERKADHRGEAVMPDDVEQAAAMETAAEEVEAQSGKIVRVKRFEVSTIPPEEAVEQMELLGHFFYIFTDATDGHLSVVYKREDGDYGLIKPIY